MKKKLLKGCGIRSVFQYLVAKSLAECDAVALVNKTHLRFSPELFSMIISYTVGVVCWWCCVLVVLCVGGGIECKKPVLLQALHQVKSSVR
ncbi:hypothetical protein [Endozoicomonas sp. ONNA2]|uniref:hypothetical protein n=1 Tax=Endozoicomonas sp. ONNA2 TaxID=2828741 RepID=UPI00214808C6|nr:hypothetical protein [Endozoicomonas sp. ONNA2]